MPGDLPPAAGAVEDRWSSLIFRAYCIPIHSWGSSHFTSRVALALLGPTSSAGVSCAGYATASRQATHYGLLRHASPGLSREDRARRVARSNEQFPVMHTPLEGLLVSSAAPHHCGRSPHGVTNQASHLYRGRSARPASNPMGWTSSRLLPVRWCPSTRSHSPSDDG